MSEQPSRHGKAEQEATSDDQTEWLVWRVFEDESPRRPSDTDDPGNGDDDEHAGDQIPNEGIEGSEFRADDVGIGRPDEGEHETERRDGQRGRAD
jgi:hypothetical protein